MEDEGATSKKRPRFSTDSDTRSGPMNVFFHPASLSKSRLSILRRRLESHDGVVVEQACQADVVLIDDQLVSGEKMKRMMSSLDSVTGSLCRVVALRWLTDGCPTDLHKYELRAKLTKDDQQNELDVTNNYNLNNDHDERRESQEISLSNSTKRIEKGFVCAHSSSSPSLNSHLTAPLERMASLYQSSNEPWRAFAYRKAIASLNRCPFKIRSGSEASKLSGLGSKMASKVAEIIEEAILAEEREMSSNERHQVLAMFTKVWGAGPVTAAQWYDLGCRSLEDVKTKLRHQLTRHQVIGLQLYEHLEQRMSREEAEALLDAVRKEATKVIEDVEVIGCGSYRRGKLTCGDLDVLITHKDESTLSGLFEVLVDNLRSKGFLTHDLTIQKDGRQSKYLGVCRLNSKSKYRRLDIIVVPPDERATALLYFTGSAHFNRSMRLLATKMGMSLSEHALSTNVARSGKAKLNEGVVLTTNCEKDVFKHLGIEYREPWERDH